MTSKRSGAWPVPEVCQHSKQLSKRARPDAAFAILRADLERNSPLFKQNSIGVNQVVARVVNVSRLRGHAVQLDDFEVAARFEVVHRRRTDIEPSKAEPVE